MLTLRVRFPQAALLVSLTLAACAPAPATLQPSGALFAPRTGDTRAEIDAEDLRLRVGILAHDSLLGRDTGSPGIASAALYLSSEMERLGLRPAGDNGSYLQSVPLQRRMTRLTASVVGETGTVTLGADEILSVAGIGGLPRTTRETGEGALVYAGHLVDPTVGARELDPSRLLNAAVIIRLSAPEGVDPATAAPRMTLTALFGPASPAAAILLVAEEGEQEFWHYADDIARKGAVTLGDHSASGPEGPPFFLITEALAERVVGGPLLGAREPRTDLGTLRFSMTAQVEPLEAWNVAAILPGRDPARAGEHVGLGAHYDHIGVGRPVDGDSIYNGADDNASGTAALLEVAEALAHMRVDLRPARSILIVWKTGEEHGLLGSEHFTDFPTVPRQSIVAHLNLDMVGRNHPDSLMVVGSRRIATELGDLVDRVNQRQPRPFIFDYSYDVPGHPEQIYCRSDHYSYARYGIPITFFTTGLHEDYHLPSDLPEKIDHEKLARVSGLVLDVAMEIANRPGRPRVDRPVPPLGAPCQ
jgi:hypothetical protein